MTDRTKDIDVYQNEGSLLTVGPTQVLQFSNLGTPQSGTIDYDDSAPNDGDWNSGESASINGNAAVLAATGSAYAGVKVTLLGITLADIKLSTPVNIGVINSDGDQLLRFYNDDGTESDPAELLDALASRLVTALSGAFGPLLQPLVDAILADPIGYLETNSLLTVDLTSGGTLPFVPCFAAGTLIVTKLGEVPVESLGVGDLVLTVDRGYRPVRWIGKRIMSASELRESPNLRPIRIREGALGDGLPIRDLVVSPQHRCLVRSRIAERMVGTREVLVAAKQLLGLDGVEVEPEGEGVTYFHIMLETHELLFTNGALTESFFVGPQAMGSIHKSARDEIMAIFPELRDQIAEKVMPPARYFMAGYLARSLVSRASKNSKPVVETKTYVTTRLQRDLVERPASGAGLVAEPNSSTYAAE